jgi:hypothetical protein
MMLKSTVTIKRSRKRSSATALTAAALAWFAAGPAAASVVYNVTVDTSSVSGQTGFLDFQFNPGNVTTQAATAQILNFSGGTIGPPPSINGNVTGNLPNTVTMVNSTALNEDFQGFTYGSTFSFTLVLSGPAIDSPNGTANAGSTFGLGLYDAGQNPILTNQGAVSGFAGEVDINLNGTTTVTTFPRNSAGGPSVVTIAQALASIPTLNGPGLVGLALLLLAAAALVLRRGRRAGR